MEELGQKKSLFQQIVGLPANFWYANFMEILERLAFFGVRAIAPLYLVREADQNGLGLSYADKGQIYMWWALIQCLVPMVSGGFTERYGYRKSLVVAFTINVGGYLLMAQSLPLSQWFQGQGWAGAGFWVFLAASCLIGFGTAIFKPPVHGTIAKTTDEETASMGWGLFYWVVNIGGALAPMCAAQLRGEINWHYVFYGAAIVTACNFIPLFLLYREPEKSPRKEGETEKGMVGTFVSSIATILKDPRLVVFLLIFSCFWLMFMQLWDLLPNFIDEWVDSSDVAPVFGAVNKGWVLPNGQVKPEMLINLNSISIIALVLFVSWMIRKMNKVAAMIVGMLISLVGFVAAGMTMVGWLCCLMILVFSIGEMTCSPTFSAYVGLIAPKDKKALYMGYSNIPFAIGWAVGNLIGGFAYDAYSAKAALAFRHLGTNTELVARAAQGADWSGRLEKLPALLGIERDQAFEVAQAELGVDADAAAERLREIFRYDRGQIENLALQYVALHPKHREEVIRGLAKVVGWEATELGSAAGRFSAEVEVALGAQKPAEDEASREDSTTTAPGAAQARPALSSADRIIEHAESLQNMVPFVRGLASGELELEDVGIGGCIHVLPMALQKSRSKILAVARDLIAKERPDEKGIADSAVGAVLWQRFGSDPDVLDNLALEYLAQSTGRVREAVVAMTFESDPEEMEQRLAEIEARVGFDQAGAFGALALALGRTPADVEQMLQDVDAPAAGPTDRLYIALVGQPEHRFEAIREHDWEHDQTLLRELVRTDEAALDLVLEDIDKQGFFEWVFAAVRSLFGVEDEPGEMTEEGVDYKKLAGKKDLIDRALTVKDWTRAPEGARRLLQLNRYEARKLLAADARQAKQVLWDAYHPWQVWVYLGAIGLAGTLGMIIFYFATRKALALHAAKNAGAEGATS